MKTPFNAHVTEAASYTVPTGKTAEFYAFGVSTLTIDDVEVFNSERTAQIGPLTAEAGAVIAAPRSQGCGLSGYLVDET